MHARSWNECRVLRQRSRPKDLGDKETRGRSRALPTSGTTRRIRLPGDLAHALEYLDDAELRKLQDAVNDEIKRRTRKAVTKESVRPADKEAVQIPEGQVNLIRASFKAGLKPAAIARTLGVSLSLVRRVLQSNVSL